MHMPSPHVAARFAAGVLGLAILCAAAAGEAPPGGLSSAPPSSLDASVIRPEEVRAGMKGYGLTVLKGAEPTRFEIEVVGRLANVMPRQDIILIRVTDERLAASGVAAGMSGSPIYVACDDGKDRLLGALAYSWAFQKEAVAGVTPITNMLSELDAGMREGGRLGEAPAQPGADLTPAPEAEVAERTPLPAWPSGAIRPMRAPVVVSGLSPRLFAEAARELSALGMEPIQGGSGSAEGAAVARPPRPGDAVGVQLMRGDSSFTAIGTVTYVNGRHVLAFGHPFLLAGRWEAPLTSADVQWVLASNYSSFKMANAGAEVGRLVADRQAGIVGELGGELVRMMPIEVRVRGEGIERAFRYETVRHRRLTPILAHFAIADSIDAAFPHITHAKVTCRQRMEIAGHGALSLTTIDAVSGAWSNAFVEPLAGVLNNPFETAAVDAFSCDIAVEPGRHVAAILSASTYSREAQAGSTVDVMVRLKPFGSEDRIVSMPVRIPAEPRRGQVEVRIAPASSVRPDVAPPKDLAGLIRFVEAVYPSTSLAAVVKRQTKGLREEGLVLPALPSSVVNVLSRTGSDAKATDDEVHFLKDTDWVLSGGASLTLRLVERP
jgi:hypothetical protein